MNKLCILAALLLATTAAHAGNSVSFEIEGHRIHIEAPKNCDSLSCLKISAPGLSGSGFNLKGFRGFNNDDDDVADNSAAPAPSTAPAPKAAAAPAVQATAPPAPAPAPVAPATPAPIATAVASPAPAPVATPEWFEGPGLRVRRHVLRRTDLEAHQLTLRVIPGWSERPDLRCAIAHRGISGMTLTIGQQDGLHSSGIQPTGPSIAVSASVGFILARNPP
jgi:hypothetical protein